MKRFEIIGIASLIALASSALAQSDSLDATGIKPPASATVELMTTDNNPVALGTTYAIGQLNNDSYTYGDGFLIQVTYANFAAADSLGLAFSSGDETDYTLAYTHDTGSSPGDIPLSTPVGTVDVTGGEEDVYVDGSNSGGPFTTFTTSSGQATVFNIGALSSIEAAVDLSATVTITATIE